jgi:hypothetical protein
MRRINGGIIGPRLTITTNFTTASGIWDNDEYSRLWALDLWPSFSNLTVTYTISGNSSATFNNVTVTGNAGGAGSISGGSGGTYSITNNNGTGGGATGGNGWGTGGFGGNGTSGGAIGNGYGNPAYSNDIGGLYAAVTLAGYTGNSSFGAGGIGGANYGNAPAPGAFSGGGGGGGAYVGGGYGTGGDGSIVIQYKVGGTNYCTVRTSSGSFTIPKGTLYLKMWAIGKGGDGNPGPGGANSGAGGGAGGVSYCEFII